MLSIIEKKKLGKALTKEEIEYFVEGATNGTIPDYQLSALMMAIYFQKMNLEETTYLTLAMTKSGDRADLSFIDGIKVDKHSTGGVGDSTTMVVAPLVVACGGIVAKMSGRGLGHTGGTLDKLMSIPNMRIQFSSEEFEELVLKNKLAVVGQSQNLAPADKVLYSLRDVTATVDNVSLIASSIMSKKIAGGSDAIVLDVKFGSGSLVGSYENARELADIMIGIGEGAGVKTRAVLSDMNQPLGRYIGNALEVVEVVETLKGMHNDSRLLEVCYELGSNMLELCGVAKDLEHGKELMKKAIEDGSGLQKLKDMFEAQGGDPSVVDDTSKLPTASKIVDVTSDKAGKVTAMDTKDIGRSAMLLGAGREKKEDVIDSAVGLVMECELGDEIKVGDVICTMHINDETNEQKAIKLFKESIIIE